MLKCRLTFDHYTTSVVSVPGPHTEKRGSGSGVLPKYHLYLTHPINPGGVDAIILRGVGTETNTSIKFALNGRKMF